MTRIDMLSSNLSAGMVEAVITVTLTVCLLVLRHLLSQKPIAMLLGSGKAGLGPFRWPLNGTPRMVAAHRLLVAVLLGGAAGSVALVLFGACGVVKLAGGANRVRERHISRRVQGRWGAVRGGAIGSVGRVVDDTIIE